MSSRLLLRHAGDHKFYPAWAVALPMMLLSFLQGIVETCLWSSMVYWVRCVGCA